MKAQERSELLQGRKARLDERQASSLT
jgi:hypothetical protein